MTGSRKHGSELRVHSPTNALLLI